MSKETGVDAKVLIDEFYKRRDAFDPRNSAAVAAWHAIIDKVRFTKGFDILMPRASDVKSALLQVDGNVVNASGRAMKASDIDPSLLPPTLTPVITSDPNDPNSVKSVMTSEGSTSADGDAVTKDTQEQSKVDDEPQQQSTRKKNRVDI